VSTTRLRGKTEHSLNMIVFLSWSEGPTITSTRPEFPRAATEEAADALIAKKQIALFAWLPFLAADFGCLFGGIVASPLQRYLEFSLINADGRRSPSAPF